jgi:plastocyanin
MEGTAFDPTEITVAAGEPVVIAVDNLDGFTHTLTVYNDEEFTDPQGAEVSLDGNESGEIEATFDAATYFFRCEIHPSMQGTLTAE